MDNQNPAERSVPIMVRGSRAFRQFKNPPQPHMCIQDTIKETTEKLYINVLGWNKIANPKQYNDPIPLYGGMQIPQGCRPNSSMPPLLVFAVMVNPDILKANGKNAANPKDREALVTLLCDFVEAMNPGLLLTRNPTIMKDKDLAGELKDVWLAIQNKREREKGLTQDIMYKVYDIDGIGADEVSNDDAVNGSKSENCEPSSPTKNNTDKKSSKQILMNAGQKSEFDSGMNNCQINQNSTNRDTRSGISQLPDTTYCTPMYGQIVSSRENHNQINDIQEKLVQENAPSTSFRKEWSNNHRSMTWSEYNKSEVKNGEGSIRKFKVGKSNPDNKINNGKSHYNFFPDFNNKGVDQPDIDADKPEKDSNMIIDPLQKLVLHATDNNICDNKSNAISSISS